MIEFDKFGIEERKTPESGDCYGEFVIEPLEHGFGVTLGNALRRILLSSIPGAAVTSVKIDGVLHEFSTVPGVKEDVAEIILNIKQLALKCDHDEAQTIIINATEEGEVTGADILTTEAVEVINKDLHIATMDKDSRLYIEMVVETGNGYVSAEKNKSKNDELPIGTIPIDSIYTPVHKVNFSVEDTRVGQDTEKDRLMLTIGTNGNLTPTEALSWAARILTDHLEPFIKLKEGMEDTAIMIEKEEEEKDKVLDMTIEELDLSVRSYNCLKRAGINTVLELTQKTKDEMMKVRNLGKKSLEEVTEKMGALGLSLKSNDE
ncbi:MAG: DNA-directed RNA polymerase subunit alpha [Clostridiales bacterium]|uniref:DNA-directed RNA polymerase subunit alpha n=1 Tax=Peptococcus niger TaxID=2741 RepID=A0A1G6TFG6_PEPNI|nr:DNA-directed RNA polymerase subunit alpha [Peptococcus niger]MBS5916424.1 DNA-directed RNA polymerase subunit alpha [Clostridiales bacterium]MDU7505678.1 DNA-directed RNA polymerase subunit alpha [Clostridia bacterium]MDU1028826.1 DNA-directed RNA polymerase subunit alpha [Clostridiales bacterium]MDU2293406.1 DNA-directed RNA polymerase subunit alpha [Peptococcus niger]MDU5952821.1 DNA-directed RNA polymerase subunit alpha [Clostridiales bacterium]